VHQGGASVKEVAAPFEGRGHSGQDPAPRHTELHLFYTDVTRAKRLVVPVGQKQASAIAVKNVSGRHRWSKLREWLGRGSMPSG
jgi:hypothetical protein